MLGKTRRPEMRAVLDDYVRRIGRSCPIEIMELRDGDALKKLDADRAATVVLLDAAGKNLDSNALAKWLGELRDRGTRELIFSGIPFLVMYRVRDDVVEILRILHGAQRWPQ